MMTTHTKAESSDGGGDGRRIMERERGKKRMRKWTKKFQWESFHNEICRTRNFHFNFSFFFAFAFLTLNSKSWKNDSVKSSNVVCSSCNAYSTRPHRRVSNFNFETHQQQHQTLLNLRWWRNESLDFCWAEKKIKSRPTTSARRVA